MAIVFFWQGLVISIILSIILSIVLTLVLNLSSKKRAGMFEDEIFGETKEEQEEREREGKESRKESKTGGFILIGPIPIIFGSGGVRFDKNGFKWALLFFALIVFTFLMAAWVIRFI